MKRGLQNDGRGRPIPHHALQRPAAPIHRALYTNLPVLFVDDWSAVTRSFLESAWEANFSRSKRVERGFRIEKSYLPYWLFEITKAFPEQKHRVERPSNGDVCF